MDVVCADTSKYKSQIRFITKNMIDGNIYMYDQLASKLGTTEKKEISVIMQNLNLEFDCPSMTSSNSFSYEMDESSIIVSSIFDKKDKGGNQLFLIVAGDVSLSGFHKSRGHRIESKEKLEFHVSFDCINGNIKESSIKIYAIEKYKNDWYQYSEFNGCN